MTRPPTEPVRFLLVDDLEENLLALEGLLRRDGLELLKARSGREALELLLAHDVALAVVDVQMPEIDGFELAELMRGTERTRRVPIIFLTAGSADERRRFRGYEAGAVDYLYKPVEPHVLRGKAEVFFELYRQRDELRRVADENARLYREVRDSDRRKDEFLALLAHELRNPLAPIRMGLELLRVGGDDPEAVGEAIETMEGQLRQMTRLIDDLLDVSRITRGKLELRKQRVGLADVVRTAVDAVRPLVAAARHDLRVSLPEAPLAIEADPVRLSQVFSNLLNNAVKYTPDGGTVALTAERAGGEVRVSVRDTGVGIPGAMLESVFEMFTQVDRTLERSHGGLGIGLHLVRKLVVMHGGNVEARSEGEGRGSEFVVRLPLAPAAVPTGAAAPAAEGRSAGGRRILVADDNRDAADLLARVLRALGHEARTTHDGLSAVEMAAEHRPDVALLDIGMPGLNGYEVARRIRGERWGEEMFLVALTGWGGEEDRRRSEAAGFDRHLVKPVEPLELRRILADAGPGEAGRETGHASPGA